MVVIRRMHFRYTMTQKQNQKPNPTKLQTTNNNQPTNQQKQHHNPKVNLYKCEAGYFHSSLVRTTFPLTPPRSVKKKTTQQNKLHTVKLK